MQKIRCEFLNWANDTKWKANFSGIKEMDSFILLGKLLAFRNESDEGSFNCQKGEVQSKVASSYTYISTMVLLPTKKIHQKPHFIELYENRFYIRLPHHSQSAHLGKSSVESLKWKIQMQKKCLWQGTKKLLYLSYFIIKT